MYSIKKFLRTYSPVWLFSVLSKIWNFPIRAKEKFKQKDVSIFTKSEIVQINVEDINFSIIIDPINGYVDETIYKQRGWEPAIANVLKKEIRAGDVCVDIGANIGYFTILMSKLTGEDGKVFAFEPINSLYEQASESIRINNLKNVTLYNTACGEERKTGTIYTFADNIGKSSLLSEAELSTGTEVVTVDTLDTLLKNIHKIDFMKIDVEGYEFEVLVGGKEILQKHKPKIIFEYNPSRYTENTTPDKVFIFLKEFWYNFYTIKNEKIDDFQSLVMTQLRLGDTKEIVCT